MNGNDGSSGGGRKSGELDSDSVSASGGSDEEVIPLPGGVPGTNAADGQKRAGSQSLQQSWVAPEVSVPHGAVQAESSSLDEIEAAIRAELDEEDSARHHLAPKRRIDEKPKALRPSGQTSGLQGATSHMEKRDEKHGVPSATPSEPLSEQSMITSFSKAAGDPTRSRLVILVVLIVAGLVWLFAFPKEPPAGIDAPSERQQIPQEIIQDALTREKSEAEKAVAAEERKVPALVAPNQPKGKLLLKSDPPVDVWNKDTLLGRTPLEADLAPGSHRLRLTDKKTGINKYRTFKIVEAGSVKRSLVFGQATLAITAPDGAKVSLGSRSLGQAPFDPIKIYEGRYMLRAQLGAHKWAEWLRVDAGKRIEYNIRFNAEQPAEEAP